MYTIGQVAKRFGLSRSALLYYDTIGLLSPSARTISNYRLYSEDDIARMEKIVLYREAGLPLEGIAEVLTENASGTVEVLQARLAQIAKEMQTLREQQRVIAALLKDREIRAHERNVTKEQWIAILRATGLEEQDMLRWHMEFERMAPEAHQAFLESLGIAAEEIGKIRLYAREVSAR